MPSLLNDSLEENRPPEGLFKNNDQALRYLEGSFFIAEEEKEARARRWKQDHGDAFHRMIPLDKEFEDIAKTLATYDGLFRDYSNALTDSPWMVDPKGADEKIQQAQAGGALLFQKIEQRLIENEDLFSKEKMEYMVEEISQAKNSFDSLLISVNEKLSMAPKIAEITSSMEVLFYAIEKISHDITDKSSPEINDIFEKLDMAAPYDQIKDNVEKELATRADALEKIAALEKRIYDLDEHVQKKSSTMARGRIDYYKKRIEEHRIAVQEKLQGLSKWRDLRVAVSKASHELNEILTQLKDLSNPTEEYTTKANILLNALKKMRDEAERTRNYVRSRELQDLNREIQAFENQLSLFAEKMTNIDDTKKRVEREKTEIKDSDERSQLKQYQGQSIDLMNKITVASVLQFENKPELNQWNKAVEALNIQNSGKIQMRKLKIGFWSRMFLEEDKQNVVGKDGKPLIEVTIKSAGFLSRLFGGKDEITSVKLLSPEALKLMDTVARKLGAYLEPIQVGQSAIILKSDPNIDIKAKRDQAVALAAAAQAASAKAENEIRKAVDSPEVVTPTLILSQDKNKENKDANKKEQPKERPQI